MIDNDFFKATEICLDEHSSCAVEQCPFDEECGKDPDALLKYALALINRLKVENAELLSELTITKNNFDNAKERYDEAVKIGQKINDKLVAAYKKLQTAKSEAIKEFAERLKTTDLSSTVGEHYINGEMYGYFDSGGFGRIIDNLVKEMTGDSFTKIEHNSLCETETYKNGG